MNRLGLVLLLVGGLCTSAALSTAYQWTGGGTTNCWNDDDNWNPVGYPDDASDGAEFPATAAVWEVGLVTETIATLSIKDDTTFGVCQETPPTLTVGYLMIKGPATTGYTRVLVNDSATIETN